MKRKQKKSKKRKGGNTHFHWEDDFEGGERPKIKIGNSRKNRQQARQAIRVGDYDFAEGDDDE